MGAAGVLGAGIWIVGATQIMPDTAWDRLSSPECERDRGEVEQEAWLLLGFYSYFEIIGLSQAPCLPVLQVLSRKHRP